MSLIRKPIRISPSAINTFYKCSTQYKWTVIDELIPDPGTDNLYAVLGSSVHKATELNDLYKVSYEELKVAWKVLFLSFLSETKFLSKDIDYQKFLTYGYDLLKKVFKIKKRWKGSKIIAVERYVRKSYPNKWLTKISLSGRIDLIIKNSENVFTAIDWKTGKTTSYIDIENDLQMSFYIFFVNLFYKIDFDNIFGALVFPAIDEVLFTQRTIEDLQKKMFDKIDKMLERISKNDFCKEPKLNNKLNDCKFCPYIISCDKRDE